MEINTFPTVRERVHRQRLAKRTPNVQEHKRVELRGAEARLFLHGQERNTQ